MSKSSIQKNRFIRLPRRFDHFFRNVIPYSLVLLVISAASLFLLSSCDDNTIKPPSGPDPVNWIQMESGTTENLRDIWGRDANDMFAVGDNGTVLHYDGTGWTRLATHLTTDLFCVLGNEGLCTFAAGDSGTILQYDGDFLIGNRPPPTTYPIVDLWSCDPSFYALVGDPVGTIFEKIESTSWKPVPTGSGEELTRLIGFSHSCPYNYSLIAVGRSGTAYSFSTECCTREWHAMDTGTSEDLVAVFGDTPGNLFAIGSAGTIVQNNQRFVKEPASRSWREFGRLGGDRINDVMARNHNDIFMVGDNGRIVHFNRETFIEMNSSVNTHLNAVWAMGYEVFVVGDNGLILKYSKPAAGTQCPANAVISITAGLTPTISWSPACPVSKLIIERIDDPAIKWFIAADGDLIESGIEFGSVPANAIDFRPAEGLLEAGALYRVTLIKYNEGNEFVIGTWNIRPEDTNSSEPVRTYRIDRVEADDSYPCIYFQRLFRVIPGQEIFAFIGHARAGASAYWITDPAWREDLLNIRPVMIESIYRDPVTGRQNVRTYTNIRAADLGSCTVVWDVLDPDPIK